ncbi:MAG: tRNA-dihydrouridine synthase, partial [Limisphaerales bacterium]
MPKASQVRFGIAIRLAKREKNQAVTTLSEQASQFDALLQRDEPMLALAPMQDVTDLPFWRVITNRGGADVYFTEYFRVHADSRLEKPILRSITENPTGRPVVAQMIGNSIPDLVRTARELQQHPIAGIDL